jgi:hypothetical protein
MTEWGRDLARPAPSPRSLPPTAVRGPEEESAPPIGSTCPLCSGPLAVGTEGIRNHGEMAHLKCPPSPPSVNSWPEGVRRLLCLNCGRTFPSESKMQRLCKGCR